MKSELQKLKKEVALLLPLVYKDLLTGLYNRRGFLEEGEKIFLAVRQARQYKSRRRGFLIKDLSLIFVDFDGFKKVNDTFGHPAGDTLLKSVAGVLVGSLRVNDLVGRWGGDEMVILLVGATNQDAERIAEELRKKIEAAEFRFKSKKMKITASLGVAGIGKDADLESLVSRADKAMYRAKKEGKNKVVAI
jgi:diguanylate cyclase (GGDEF)-like protein